MLNGDAGEQPGMVSTFFRRVAKHFANEVAVVTPNGKLLSHDLDKGWKKWREIPAEERRSLDDLGKFDSSFLPEPPRGGLIAKVYSRGLVRDKEGRLQIYKTKVARSLEAGRDHLWLTETEVRSLLPEKLDAGTWSSISHAIVDRIVRRYLIDLVRVGGNGGPRRAEEVMAAEMTAVVERSTASEVRLRIEGFARLATSDVGSGAKKGRPKVDRFDLLGYATFDRHEKHASSFDLVAFSKTGHYDEISKTTVPLGVAFELTNAETPADRVPPSSYSKSYFGSSKSR